MEFFRHIKVEKYLIKLFGVSHLFQKVLNSDPDVCILLIIVEVAVKERFTRSMNKILHLEEDT